MVRLWMYCQMGNRWPDSLFRRGSPFLPLPANEAVERTQRFRALFLRGVPAIASSSTQIAVDSRMSSELPAIAHGRDAEMKTNKHQTLLLVKKQQAAHARDLVQHFAYAPGTARSYLSHLGRQGLLEHIGANYGLTEKGRNACSISTFSAAQTRRARFVRGRRVT